MLAKHDIIQQMTVSKNIISDPSICHGKPVFKGTRIMVWQILELLENDTSEEEIFEAYPTLPKTAIRDALAYAADKLQGVNYVHFKKDGRVLA